MHTNTLLRKGLTIAIIVVLGTNIIPIVGSLSLEKHTSVNNPRETMQSELMITNPRGINITIYGTMGDNGWYVSNVIIVINCSESNRTYYSFDNNTWTEYTAPITVSTDGYYNLYVYFVYPNGDKSIIYGPYPFKIDKTPPYVKITSPEPGFLYISIANFIFMKIPIHNTTIIIGTIIVSANATDNLSGVNRVEFWVNDQQYCNGTSPPYNWTWSWNGHCVPYELKVIAFDNAGNQNSDELTVWKIF